MTWKPVVGKSFSPSAFEAYVASLKFGLWRPKFVVVHNTSAPDTRTWQGWQVRKPPVTDEKWAQNLVGYYRDQQHWSAWPHLFVTPGGILAFSPLTGPGVHSPAWNSISWGVETVVDKVRDIYLIGNVRVHVDSVHGLGEFIEFEAVYRDARGRLTVSRVEFQARYELCEDMAQLLVEPSQAVHHDQGVSEDLVLARTRTGLATPEAGFSETEAVWVVTRLAELLGWPAPSRSAC